MPSYEEYRNPEEPIVIEVKVYRCRFEGCLYERFDGGHDLYLSMLNADMDNLPQEKFNLLYDQTDASQQLFLLHYPDVKMSRGLQRKAREFLRQWLEGQLGSG